MLTTLQVRNFAIIDATELTLGRGLNVVTGETGAGKSILVGAIGLALGARASPDLVRAGATHAEVTALFDVTNRADLRKRLDAAGIDWDDELVVRRVVSAESSGGRSRAYVNGRVVSLAQLTHLVAGIADITSQHEQQSLGDPNTHLELLDAAGGHASLRQEVAAAYSRYSEASRELDSLVRDLRQRTDREDLLRYQVKEIDELSLADDDYERLLSVDRERLRNASRLHAGAAEAEQLLYAGDGAAIERLTGARKIVEDLARFDPVLGALAEQLESTRVQVDDVARVLGQYSRHAESDPERLADIEDRLQKLAGAKRKYGSSVAAIREFGDRARAELARLDQGEARIQDLERLLETTRDSAASSAAALSRARHRAAVDLAESISRELESLAMGGARVVVDVTPASPAAGDLAIDGQRLLPSGVDRVEFLIAPNRGEEPRPLRKIASGGELSRALLAIKRVLTDVSDASMYVFDEVDSGIGGAVAEVIGQKLRAVSRRNQVLAITHLAQIAAYADQHFVVGKRETSARTVSEIRELSAGERVDEMARMVGGIKVTDKTRATAREMLRSSLARG